MKRILVTVLISMLTISAFSQKKSKDFIMPEPSVIVLDNTNIPLIKKSPYMNDSKCELTKYYNSFLSVSNDPIKYRARGYNDYQYSEIHGYAEIKRRELRCISDYDNMFKNHRIMRNPNDYTIDDIRLTTVISNEKTRNQYNGIKCYTQGHDTIVVSRVSCSYNGFGKLVTNEIEKFKPAITLEQYVKYRGYYTAAETEYKKKYDSWVNDLKYNNDLTSLYKEVTELNNKELTHYADWLNTEKEDDREKREEQKSEINEKHILGDILYEFEEPTSPVKTKSLTNALGANMSYEYYVNDNGYEVKHGKYSVTMNFNNHKYWTGLSAYGWVYIDGIETLTCHYRNGILHGKLTYNRNISTTSTFGNAMKLKDSYNFDIYKGFISGNFKFGYKGITYTGKAINGILEYCDYQTNDGFHGKLSSIPNNPAYSSIAKIDTGYRTFEFDSSIELPSIIATMPLFRFPLIGSNE